MKISEITQSFAFTEFDYVREHLSYFNSSELGIMKSEIPFDFLIQAFKPSKISNRRTTLVRPLIFDIKAQLSLMFLKAKYTLSDKALIERLNTDISFQLFCDVIIPASSPILNYKIVSRIRTSLSSRIDINKFQKAISNKLKFHISSNDLRCVMSDATCYESYLRFPTNQKLLWGSI